MTSSSRTPSWAANELPQWIISLAFWLYRHRSSGPGRSWIGCGTFPRLQGRTSRRLTTILPRFNNLWCSLRKSCRTMATMSSTLRRATTVRSRKEINVFLPWGISWQPFLRLRLVEDNLKYKWLQVDGEKSWGLVMEFGHQNHRGRGFLNGSRSKTQQCLHRGSTGSHRCHLLRHHLDTRHHHSLTHRHNHHRRKQDRHHHRHHQDRVHRDLRRQAQLDRHRHRRHPSLRRSQCQGVRLQQRTPSHQWHHPMWSHIAECW